MADPDVDGLAGHFPGWRIWRRREDGMLCAWLLESKPPLVVYGTTPEALREQIEIAHT